VAPLESLQSKCGRVVVVVVPLLGDWRVGAIGGGGGVVKLKTVAHSPVPLALVARARQ
jgi:hypothetical protein